MLSRTAEGLFWLGRSMERADNVARFLEAGQRLHAMSGKSHLPGSEWAAILIAAGCRSTFPGDLETASAQDAIRHLVLDPDNPSSIMSCFANARANARAQRGAISAETWAAANDAWREGRALLDRDCAPRYLSSTLERMRRFTALFRGAVSATMLNDERLSFLRLGELIERADATARLLDVKYHVLMPDAHPIGSGMDQLQWDNLLRASGTRTAYRWVYHKPVDSRLVIDFLLLNTRTPRSFLYCVESAAQELEYLHAGGAAGRDSLDQVLAMRDDLQSIGVDGIIDYGLHEYLTTLVIRSNTLALSIGTDFGFQPIIIGEAETQVQ
ncbi:MAG: alpha-E domain-containing protein [Marinibacterium sp.]|nr:alpha-E domain-containing protein [Marinibacterium sp.]